MQTASLKTPSSPLTAVVKAVAATVMIGLCVAIFPVVPVLVPLMALPVAHVVARWGVPLGALVTVTATALIYVGIGISAATLMFLLLTGVGMVLGQALGKGRPFARTFALMVVAAFVAFILWGLVVWLALGVDLTGLKEAAYTSIDDAAATYQQLGMSQATAAAASDQMRGLIDVIPYLAPGLAGMVSILLAACSLALAYWIFPRLRNQVAISWSFAGLRVHWATAYASIVGLGMLLFSGGSATWRGVLLYVGLNLLLVSQTLFFIQGLAVARWFVVSRGLRPGSRAAIYIAAILGQMLQLTGLVGLFDTWVDYRKRFALKGPKAGSMGDFHKE
jgi:uncharacterized protein YybS (DUF2232 family)